MSGNLRAEIVLVPKTLPKIEDPVEPLELAGVPMAELYFAERALSELLGGLFPRYLRPDAVVTEHVATREPFRVC